ncbi:hypothetical protein [uncultured Croceitalea sp.]|uniref:hypothetical protein n=1 Tax=uncultured Croceitalea sp. TaxID=1798908 RepID=UPI0033068AFF
MNQQIGLLMFEEKKDKFTEIISKEQLAELLLGLRYLYHLYLQGKLSLEENIQSLISYFYEFDENFKTLIDKQLKSFRKLNNLPLDGTLDLEFCTKLKIQRVEITSNELEKARDVKSNVVRLLRDVSFQSRSFR